MGFATLPPDCIIKNDIPLRIVRHYKMAIDAAGKNLAVYELDADGEPVVEWVEERRICETLEEARAKRFDFYSSEFGWMREGYKLEKDRDTASILAK